MAKIITHKRPHLDDICAAWLFKRYVPEFRDAEVGFVSVDDTAPLDESATYVGVRRGRFDEHKGDVGECATTLVWKHIKEIAPPADKLERLGVEKLVDWVRLEDTGMLLSLDLREFAVPAILSYHYEVHGRDSANLTEFGFVLLDDLLSAQKNAIMLADDWEERREFESIFGPAVAVMTSARDIDSYAYLRGFNLVVYVSRERNYHNIRAAAGSTIDLTPIYNQIKAVEPNADWYLHHSKKMILCGGDLTGQARTSKLTLEWVVDLLTPNYVRSQRY